MFNAENLLKYGLMVILPIGCYAIFSMDSEKKQKFDSTQKAIHEEHDRKLALDLERIKAQHVK